MILKVRGDTVGALTLLIKMRPASPTIAAAIAARELALGLVELSFPQDAVHTPGMEHVIADKLSRVHAPRGSGEVNKNIHPALASAEENMAPLRNLQRYRACSGEPGCGIYV